MLEDMASTFLRESDPILVPSTLLVEGGGRKGTERCDHLVTVLEAFLWSMYIPNVTSPGAKNGPRAVLRNDLRGPAFAGDHVRRHGISIEANPYVCRLDRGRT